jgi:hypothetical protein
MDHPYAQMDHRRGRPHSSPELQRPRELQVTLTKTYPCEKQHTFYEDPHGKPLPEACPVCKPRPGSQKQAKKLDMGIPISTTGRQLGPGKWELIVIGYHPLLLNKALASRFASFKLAAAKNKLARLLTEAAQVAGCPAAVGRRKVRLRLEGFTRKAPDQDSADKVVLDSLARAGLLTDDDARGLKGRMECTPVRGGEKRTILTIQEVS